MGCPYGNPRPASKPSSNVASIPQHPSHPLFVLLWIDQLATLKYSIIEIYESQDDDAFLEKPRSHYWTLCDFWHHWLDPRQFSFCRALRFVRYGANRLGWWWNEIPLDKKICEYILRPATTPYKGLLPKHEWRERFYQVFRSRGLQEAVERMPKRNCRFQISTHVSGEDVWGLRAQLQISAEMVFAGGAGHYAWWLGIHS